MRLPDLLKRLLCEVDELPGRSRGHIVQADRRRRSGIDAQEGTRTQPLYLVNRESLLSRHDEIDDRVPGDPSNFAGGAFDRSSAGGARSADAEQVALVEAATKATGRFGQNNEVRRIRDEATVDIESVADPVRREICWGGLSGERHVENGCLIAIAGRGSIRSEEVWGARPLVDGRDHQRDRDFGEGRGRLGLSEDGLDSAL